MCRTMNHTTANNSIRVLCPISHYGWKCPLQAIMMWKAAKPSLLAAHLLYTQIYYSFIVFMCSKQSLGYVHFIQLPNFIFSFFCNSFYNQKYLKFAKKNLFRKNSNFQRAKNDRTNGRTRDNELLHHILIWSTATPLQPSVACHCVGHCAPHVAMASAGGIQGRFKGSGAQMVRGERTGANQCAGHPRRSSDGIESME